MIITDFLPYEKGKTLRIHPFIAYHFRHAVTHFTTLFPPTWIQFLFGSTHTINYVIILSLMYLHPELLLFTSLFRVLFFHTAACPLAKLVWRW